MMMKPKNKVVFHLTNRGTFSELNNLVIAQSYAHLLGRPLAIDDRCWSGGYSLGFEDYFECSGIEFWRSGLTLPSVLGNTVNGASLYENYLRLLSFSVYKKFFLWKQSLSNPDVDFTPTYFEAMRLQSRAPYLLSGQIVDPIDMHNKSIQKLLNYNHTVRDYIGERIEELHSAIGNDYIACHIRRGDKVNNQMSAIGIDLYVTEINKLAKLPIFIATDDFSVVTEIRKKLPSRQIFTFADNDRDGWVEKRFRATKGQTKFHEMCDLFLDVEALVDSSFFIGTFSSCVGQFINIRRKALNCKSIDFNFYFD